MRCPGRLGGCRRVPVYFTRFGASSIAINFDVLHVKATQLAAAGREVLVCVDRKTIRPKPLPPDLVKVLAPFVMNEEGARRHLGLPEEAT